MRADDGWNRQDRLIAAEPAANDSFGYSVALAADTALVGAYGERESAGAASVFERSDGEWERQATLVADDRAAEDEFGFSVALDGDTALVGAIGAEDTTGTVTGAAYVFERIDGEWSQTAKLVPADGDIYDEFGFSVALDDGTALVGAWGDNPGDGSDAGSAYVFERTDDEWTQRTKLVAADGDSGDFFGHSVALDGETALVSARDDDDPHAEDAGSAYVFDREGGTWTQTAKLAAADGDADDYFGSSVALSGGTALVGASSDEHPHGSAGGSGYAFEWADGEWTQTAKFVASRDGQGDYFGSAAALLGDTAFFGAVHDELPNAEKPGSVYVFDLRNVR